MWEVWKSVNDLSKTAVLRYTLLGNVHAADDLKTCDKGIMYYVGNIHQLNKVAVYTDTYSCKGLERFNMDIRRVRTERVLNYSSRQLNYRRTVYTLCGFFVNTERIQIGRAHV